MQAQKSRSCCRRNIRRAHPTCRGRLSHLSWRCHAATPQISEPSRDSSLPSFSFKVTAKQAASKLRLDTYLATQIASELATKSGAPEQDVSRAKIQASIASGLVRVNGRPAGKASQLLRLGDSVECSLPPPPPLRAEPEAIPLDIRYEDDYLLVINKPAGMVVHVAPGHHSGTLVNALLHHCALPPLELRAETEGSDAGGARASGDFVSFAIDGNDDHDDDDDDGRVLDDEGGYLGETEGWVPVPGGATDSLLTVEPGARHWGAPGVVRAALLGVTQQQPADSSQGSGAPSSFPFNSSSSSPASAFLGSSSDGSTGGSGGSGSSGSGSNGGGGILRPGIVHRLDKGTSGLLVVAKTETALTRLQAQFKARTVDRLYLSITVGCPTVRQGRVEANIVRDPRDRKRMAAAPYGSGRGRTAASNFWVEAPLAGGGAALVRWKLDTGRTHQIRVHAKQIGHPLLGDETYGGSGTSTVTTVARNFPADQVRTCLQQLGRPALHALTLGFDHPITGQRLAFEQPPPDEFLSAVEQLQGRSQEGLQQALRSPR